MAYQKEIIWKTNTVHPPIPLEIFHKAKKSIGPDGTTRGPLWRQEEGPDESDNEGGITDHQYEFDNDTKNRFMYEE